MTDDAYEFTPEDLKELQHLAERITNDVKWADRRLVVEVWDRADSQPVAWIERHPSDTDATIRFTTPPAADPSARAEGGA